VGFFLASWLFHAIFTLLAILLVVALAIFIIRAITLGSPDAAWNSMKNMGNQWQQRFTTQNQQPPQYQQQQPPYYQPGQEQPQQPYGQGYQPEQPYYRPAGLPNDPDQSRTQYPEQMPPMQQ
jgi:uncharacterized protein YxeA